MRISLVVVVLYWFSKVEMTPEQNPVEHHSQAVMEEINSFILVNV